jgi:hypothetical protein
VRPSEFDGRRCVELRELLELVSRDWPIRQFDLRDKAPR